MRELLNEVEFVFGEAFGRTPLHRRVEDIAKEALELSRFQTISDVREELGDLLASCLALCSEAELDPEKLVKATLAKIESRMHQYQSMGRKQNIGIMGGSFDPLTNAHINAALTVQKATDLDQVLFMPACKHMDKELSKPDVRCRMIHQATKDDSRLGLETWEVARNSSGRLQNTIAQMCNEPRFSSMRLHFIIGQDVASTIESWEKDALHEEATFIVVGRSHQLTGDEWYLQQPHSYVAFEDDNSSTAVRELVARKQDVSDLVPPEVNRIIESERLYA